MRHLVSGRKLKRTSSHRKALLANLATELFRHKSIKTTEAKAKELRPYAESLITKAKNALLKDKSGGLADGQTIDVHSRRIVARHIRVKEVLSELFDSIAPSVIDRNGGFTRVIKTGIRRGDSGRTAIIQLVDFAEPQDGASGMKKKKKKVPVTPKTVAPVVATTPVVEDNSQVEESVETANEIVVEDQVVENLTSESTAEVITDESPESNSSEEDKV